MPPMTSGRVRTRRSLLPLRSRGWSRKRSPRKSASVSCVALDHRAHRAVEDEDARRRAGRSSVRHRLQTPGFGFRAWRWRCGLHVDARSRLDAAGDQHGERIARLARADRARAIVREAGVVEQRLELRASRSPGADRRTGSRTHAWSCSRRSSTSTRPPGRRMRTASASALRDRCAWCSACESSATSTRRVAQRQPREVALLPLDVA